MGYITPSAFNYSDTAGPNTFSVQIPAKLGQGADGSPFTTPLAQDVRVGGRQVNSFSPATRPVACGLSLTALFDDDPVDGVDHISAVICVDAGATTNTATRDLGVLGGNVTGSGGPGSLVSLPFTLRYSGTAPRRPTSRSGRRPPSRTPPWRSRRAPSRPPAQQRHPGPGGGRHPRRRPRGDL